MICIQETWFSEKTDISLYQLPNYSFVHLPCKLSRHSGVGCYIHDKYKYSVRNFNINSKIWEGLFLDISGETLTKSITVGNSYKLSKYNNSNANIETVLSEITPILEELSKSKRECLIVGDFNINLLEISAREKYYDYFDLFVSAGFFPKLTFPTRLSRRKGTIIDQIFHKSLDLSL